MMSKGVLTGKVAAILNSRELAMNIGANGGIEVGMVFRVLGEAVLKDPDTGEQLGTVRHEKGRVKVTAVEKRFAIARTFETYEVNIGGIGLGRIDMLSAVGESTARLFSPSEWVTRVQTLKYEDSGLELPEREDKSSIYVKVGDILELAEGE
jgi:hypothetical protein